MRLDRSTLLEVVDVTCKAKLRICPAQSVREHHAPKRSFRARRRGTRNRAGTLSNILKSPEALAKLRAKRLTGVVAIFGKFFTVTSVIIYSSESFSDNTDLMTAYLFFFQG